MSFDPQKYLIDMRGQDYLMVRWRVVWFRDEHPGGNIRTELVSTDPVVMRATVFDGDGRELASGFGTPKTQGVARSRPFEGAETAAVGRALALAGYGTQFTGEDEGEHLADAPVSTGGKQQKPHVPTTPDGGDQTQMVGVLDAITVQTIVESGLSENASAAAQVLARFEPKKAPLGKIVDKFRSYREHKTENGDTDAAINHANAKG